MGINRFSMTEVGYDEAINIDLTHKVPESSTKAPKHKIFSGIKHLIGKMVAIDEDWVLKSKNWPYLWTKK